MMNQMKHYLSIGFKILILTLTIIGLYLTVRDAFNIVEVLSYFTSFVNLLTALLFFILLINLILYQKKSNWLHFFKQTLMVCLMLTTIVYSFVLIPYISDNEIPYVIFSLKDIFIHFLVPFLVILDYAFFDEKGNFKPRFIFGNLLTLSFYTIYLTTYIGLGGRFNINGVENMYPYFFLDIPSLGLINFAWIVMAILFLVFLISWVVYKIDQILGIPLESNLNKRK